MIAQKQGSNISAKEVEDGRIEWSHELPENCELNHSLKQTITPFLAGLLEVSIRYKL